MIKKFLFFLMSAIIVAKLIFVSFWLNLSDEKLTPWLEFQINSRLQRGYQVDIKRVSTELRGLRAEDIKLSGGPQNSELLYVDSLEISLNIFSLLLSQSVPYRAAIYEGEIRGALKVSGLLSMSPKFYLTFDGEGILPNNNPTLRKTELIVSNPALNIEEGTVYIDPPLRTDFTLIVKDLKLNGNPESLGIPLGLPETGFKSLSAGLSVNGNKIKTLIKYSGDISGKLKGDILSDYRDVRRSKFNLVLRAAFEKTYWTKLDLLKNFIKGYLNKSNQVHIKILGIFPNLTIEKI